MSSGALISCIMPLYNGERYLREALDSMIAQTYRPVEIIVVDDGSTDTSAQIAADYGDPVRVIQQANAGPAAARNRGIRESAGEFIAFLDADDLWEAQKLELQMERFNARPELEYCTTHAKNFWMSGLTDESRQGGDQRYEKEQPGYFCQTLMARRPLFDKVGLFDESMQVGEDTDWFLRARESQVVMEILPVLLVHRRVHDRNTSYKRYAGEGKEAQLKLAIEAIKRKRQQASGSSS